MRTMHDAVGVNSGSIPSNAQMVAGYDTDHTPSQDILWTPAMWARFPNVPHVHICGDGTNVGDVLDIESGAASVSQIAPWLQARKAATGVWKSLYYSVSMDGQVQQALAAAGIPSAQVPKWVAWYNGNPTLGDVGNVVGVVAKQYTDPPNSGGPYDLSIVADHWPGIDSSTGDFDMNDPQNVIAAARCIANDVFARPVGQDTMNAIQGDILNLGWASAWDKWAQTAGQNGELNMVTRLDNLEQAPGATPAHSHPGSGGGGGVTSHVHSTPGGTTGQPQ